jgi:Mn-containing catalase
MIQRFDKIAVELPVPDSANPAAAAAVQELMGGKFGEMSTLMNYTFQPFNFRGKAQYRPFYDLLCNIATEEYSHIEAVAAAINLLLTGATTRIDRNKSMGKTAKSKAKKGKNVGTHEGRIPHRSPMLWVRPTRIIFLLEHSPRCHSIPWAMRGMGVTSRPLGT